MTAKEFNDKYQYYIEEGHYGLAFEHKEAIEWLDTIFSDFVKIRNFKYHQIKIKFGYVRFYSSLESELELIIEEKLNKFINQ